MAQEQDEQKNVVLCGANSYDQKYYLNQQFGGLPETVRNELQIMCVMYTEEIGGILTLEFEPDGTLIFRSMAEENDFFYDEIGSGLKIRSLQNEKQELLEALELYYRVFFLKEKVEGMV